MAPEEESCNDGMSVSMSIHIPWDILNEHTHYKCPTAVNIQLSPKNSPRRHSRRPSHSTKGQGQLAKGSDRRMTMSSKEPTSSDADASACLSGKQLSSLRSSVMERRNDVDSGVQSSFHDVIEMVAAANEHLTDFTDPSELPELRTSPCLFHYRNKQNGHLSPHRKHGQQLLYASNFHAGCSPRSTASKRSESSDQNNDTVEMRIQMERSKLFQQDVQNGQNQTYHKPLLPQSMTSKDFIKSWLQHGSHPIGHNHFPEVIAPPKPTTNHCHSHSHSHSALPPSRAFNNKPMLAPISKTHVKNKKQKR